MTRYNASVTATIASPVPEVGRWLREISVPDGMPLIDLSQAAPADPPPKPILDEIARAAIEDPKAHLYGPVLGLPDLRKALAETRGVRSKQVAITAGANQAFSAVISVLCAPGDAAILPVPWYFNHKMWLDMNGVAVQPLAVGPDGLPDPERAAALITAQTRVIALVAPNNPMGTDYPPDLIHAFAALAAAHDITLVLDETYRDFIGTGVPAHALTQDPSWDAHTVLLYSFSKAYRLTGHRVGAVLGSTALLDQVEKVLDCQTICANGLGQRAAFFGLLHMGDWLAQERTEILRRSARMRAGFEALSGWKINGCGCYFAWVKHPLGGDSRSAGQRLLRDAGLLTLPGAYFAPTEDTAADQMLRFACANTDTAGLDRVFDRLQRLEP